MYICCCMLDKKKQLYILIYKTFQILHEFDICTSFVGIVSHLIPRPWWKSAVFLPLVWLILRIRFITHQV